MIEKFDVRESLSQFGRPEKECNHIEMMCNDLGVSDDGKRLLAQIFLSGRVKADDLNQIFCHAPGIVKEPSQVRALIRIKPMPWDDFVNHLRIDGYA